MDFLEQTIANLSTEEHTEFRTMLQQKGENRKDLALYDLLKEGTEMKPQEFVKALNTTNLNAYHTLRKRLMAELEKYIVLKHMEADATRAGSVLGHIALAQFMIQKSAFTVAQYFLKKAETIAVQTQRFDLLHTIYHQQITHADRLQLNPLDIMPLWQANETRYLAQQKLDLAYSLIRQQMAEARKQGTMLDVEQVIETVFRDLEITTEDANTPAYMYKLVSLARSAVVSAKDYHRFEPFIVRIYNRLKKANLFHKGTVDLETGFIYMIAHVLYRNKKFDAAAAQLSEMEKVMNEKSFRSHELLSKYISLKAAIACFSGRNDISIEILKNALEDKTLRISQSERLNMQLNLAVYYFQGEDYKMANKMIYNIGHTDHWLEDKMGKEWRFKKCMIEVIVQTELGHDDIALSKIAAIEKYFAQFFKLPAYNRAKIFLRFIKRILNHPNLITTEAFANDVKKAQLALPGEKEDLQAITFFCWLKSKMQKKNYYQTLLHAIETGDYGR